MNFARFCRAVSRISGRFIKADMASVRLCLAFGRQEPSCCTGKDDYHEADDDAPAR